MTGFTGAEATARLRDRAGKAQISFLSLSMMAKMKGKTNKAIRNDLGESCPTWISKILTMADKVMAHISPTAQLEISSLTVAKAEETVIAFIEGHMTALGVGKAFEKYGKVCHFVAECDASKLVLNPPPPAEDEPKQEGEGNAEGDVDANGKPETQEGVDVVANVKTAISTLSLTQAMELAGWLAEHINAAQAAIEKAKANAEQAGGGWEPAAELVKAKAEGDAKRAQLAEAA